LTFKNTSESYENTSKLILKLLSLSNEPINEEVTHRQLGEWIVHLLSIAEFRRYQNCLCGPIAELMTLSNSEKSVKSKETLRTQPSHTITSTKLKSSSLSFLDGFNGDLEVGPTRNDESPSIEPLLPVDGDYRKRDRNPRDDDRYYNNGGSSRR
jgi:hypothetical protein